jgi:DeoR family transcriptional regulator, suf operon transcriptional repressor
MSSQEHLSSYDRCGQEEQAIGDRELIEFVRRQGSATVQEMVEFAGVTATAVRQRLTRLLEQGLIVREAESAGRGRPTHRYSLSPTGIRTSGTNNEDLVNVLWSELRAIRDPDVRYGLLKRIVSRLADTYRDQITGDTLAERMESLVVLMRGRDVPFEVIRPEEGQLPVLKALACPYPSLAEQDRSICSMEKMLFAEVLGDGLRLKECRLDGLAHCTFDMNPSAMASV